MFHVTINICVFPYNITILLFSNKKSMTHEHLKFSLSIIILKGSIEVTK